MPIWVVVSYLAAGACFIVFSVLFERDRKRIVKAYEKAIDDYVAMRVELEQGYFKLYKTLYDDHKRILDQLTVSCAPDEFIKFFKNGCDNLYTIMASIATHIETSSVSDPLYGKKLLEANKNERAVQTMPKV